jgi:hypothetical protein
VYRLFAAPLAVLFELYFAHDKLPVLARPIVDTAALAARELDELILRHTFVRGTIAQEAPVVNVSPNPY